MIERLSTRTDVNGNTFQAEIDHKKHTVKSGYFIFNRFIFDSLTVCKREIKQYIDNLVDNGYERI